MHQLKKRVITATVIALSLIIGITGTAASAETASDNSNGTYTAAEAHAKEIAVRTKENAEYNRDTTYYVNLIKQKREAASSDADGKRIAAEAYAKEIAARTKENAENNYDTAYYVELIRHKNKTKNN